MITYDYKYDLITDKKTKVPSIDILPADRLTDILMDQLKYDDVTVKSIHRYKIFDVLPDDIIDLLAQYIPIDDIRAKIDYDKQLDMRYDD
jgi:hypothetical protein